MQLFITLTVAGAIFGGACSVLASNKNRDVLGWFVMGFLFNLVALIVIAAISPLDRSKEVSGGNEKQNAVANDLDREDLREKAAQLAAALKQSREKLS